MIAAMWRNMLEREMIMTDKEKLLRLQELAVAWTNASARLDEMVDRYPHDVIVTQYVLYAEHAAQLEEILNG